MFHKSSKAVAVKNFFSHCTKNHIFFFRMFSKDGLSKKIVLEYDLFSIIKKYGICFSQKYIFSTDGKGQMIFLKKYMENMMFSICSVKMVFLFSTNMKLPFCQKSKDGLFPKNTPKDIYIALENLIYRIKIWLYL